MYPGRTKASLALRGAGLTPGIWGSTGREGRRRRSPPAEPHSRFLRSSEARSLHTTVSAFRNGAALTPRVAPYETAMDYIPTTDVSPNIRSSLLGSGDQDAARRWMLTRGHAPPPHTPSLVRPNCRERITCGFRFDSRGARTLTR